MTVFETQCQCQVRTVDCGFPLIAHVTRQSAREMALRSGDQVVASFKATVPQLLPRIHH
jgi:molybdopterin-binding protein